MLLRTLGGLELKGATFQRPKALLLLCYLSLEGPKERLFLAELFWPDTKHPRTDLAMTLSRLRKGAPGVVASDDIRVWSQVDTDARKLFNHLERGEEENATTLYQGSFLAGAKLPNLSVELEEWVYSTREFLAGQVQGALLRLAEEKAKQEQFRAAAKGADAAYQVASADPEPETLGRLHTLMLAGNSLYTDLVRRAAEGFELPLCHSRNEARARLRETLGIAKISVPHNLPTRETSFIGRDLELVRIAKLINEHRLVTLVGPGGVGKSRLAIQVAYEYLKNEHFKDGITFVAMDALTSPTAIPASIAGAMNIKLQGADEPLIQIIRRLAQKHCLLVLDNFEHLIEGADLVSKLLESCSNLNILITSRQRLNLAEEWPFEVGGLAYPTDLAVSLEEAKQFDAIKLFNLRASRVRPPFSLNDVNLAYVIELCQLVEGVPLALELAAVWARALSCEAILKELRQNLDFLTTSAPTMPDKYRSIRASFEHSWQLLSPTEQGVLSKLSVFRGGFRREAAAEVAGATLPDLVRLVDKSLLRMSLDGRYDRHSLLYQYTQEKLSEHSEDQTEVQEKHGQYFSHFLVKHGEAIWTATGKEALAAIGEELDNILTMWRWARAALKITLLKDTALHLMWFYDHRGRYQESIELYAETTKGLQEADPKHHAALGALLVAQAWWYVRLGQHERARELAERGLKLVRPLGEPSLVMIGLASLGGVAFYKGLYDQATQYKTEALALARTAQDPAKIAFHATVLGNLEAAKGNFANAKQYYQEALELSRGEGNLFQLVAVLSNLAFFTVHTGKPQEAFALAQEGLELARDLGLKQEVPYLLSSLAEAAFKLGSYGEAQEFAQEAIRISKEMGNPEFWIYGLIVLGKVATALGEDIQAQAFFKESFDLALAITRAPELLETLLHVAALQAKQGQLKQACEWLELIVNHSASWGHTRQEATTLLKTLQTQLAPEVLEKTRERGKALKLNEVVKEIVRSPMFDASISNRAKLKESVQRYSQ